MSDADVEDDVPDAPQEEQKLTTVNPLAIQNNIQIVTRFRILCSLFTGAATGVLGVEGIPGFGLYFFQHAVLTIVFGMKCQGTPKKFFMHGWSNVTWKSMAASETFMTFLLLWTIMFNLCHIF